MTTTTLSRSVNIVADRMKSCTHSGINVNGLIVFTETESCNDQFPLGFKLLNTLLKCGSLIFGLFISVILTTMMVSHTAVLRRLETLEQRTCICQFTAQQGGGLSLPVQRNKEPQSARHSSSIMTSVQAQPPTLMKGKETKVINSRHLGFPDFLGTHRSDNPGRKTYTVKSIKTAEKEVLISLNKNLSRRPRAAKKNRLPRAVKRFVRKELRKAYGLLVNNFVGNFWDILNWERDFKPNRDLPKSMEEMPCKPEATATGKLSFKSLKDEGCPLAFFKKAKTDTKTVLLKFNSKTGRFTVLRAGLYLIHINVTVTDATNRTQVGFFVNAQSLMACPHGGFRCPHYNSHDSSQEYRVCTINGVVPLEKGDLLSLQPMVNNVSFRLEDERTVHFFVVLLQQRKVKRHINIKNAQFGSL